MFLCCRYQKQINAKLIVSFAYVSGSVPLGLHCTFLRSFDFDPTDSKTFSFNEYLKKIETFLSRGIDYLIDFGSTGDSIKGSFGVGGTVEAICTALSLFPDCVELNSKRHLILLPTSLGTDHLPLFRTCPNDNYASAPLPALLAQIRSRQIFLSLVAPGLSDSTVVDQFIVFKCNEKIGGNLGLNESLGPDWVVRLSSSLVCDEPVMEGTKTSPTAIEDNEFLNQTFVKLAAMPPEERVVAIKALLDPATSTFSNQFRQKFAAAVKSRLDTPRPMPSTINSSNCNSPTINSNSLSTPPLNSFSIFSKPLFFVSVFSKNNKCSSFVLNSSLSTANCHFHGLL